MTKFNFFRMIFPLSALLIAAEAPSAYAASAGLGDMVELSVAGDPGQSFRGDCYLLQTTGKLKRHRIKGSVPTKFWLPAKAIRCHLEKSSAKGKLILTVKRKGKNELVQYSRFPLRWIFAASSGPWGNAKGGTSASRPMTKN